MSGLSKHFPSLQALHVSPLWPVCLTGHLAKPQVPSPLTYALADQTLPCPLHWYPRALAVVAGPQLLQKTNLQRGRAATRLWPWDTEKREIGSWRHFSAQCPERGFSLTQMSSEYSPMTG